MNVKKIISNQVINLRRQAEKIAARITEKHESLSPEETRQALY